MRMYHRIWPLTYRHLTLYAGFVQAFDTEATWDFTFFAPSNTAFENLGTYWQTFAATPKGKWWIGNQLKTHYVPNSILDSNSFNSTSARVQTSTYLWLSAQMVSGRLLLNQVATVTEADIPVTNVGSSFLQSHAEPYWLTTSAGGCSCHRSCAGPFGPGVQRGHS